MRMTLKLRRTATASAAVALVAAGAALAAPGAAHAAPAAPGTQVTGTLANGTIWIAEYPANWNGTHTLVEWADPNVELLAATTAAGPYNPVLGATSPYQVPAGSPQQFFRTRFAVAP